MNRFYSARAFIDQLLEMQQLGPLLLRGVTNENFMQVPKAFRQAVIDKFSNVFPHSNEDIQKWFLKALENIRCNPNKVLAHFATDSFIKRLFQLLIINLRYNYALYQKYHISGFPKNCNDEKLIEIIELGEKSYWSQEKTFLDYVDRYYTALIPLVSLAGDVIKQPYVMEDITGLDESYPQHYDMETSALDWTHNPLSALFFTIYSDKLPSNLKFLSISAYRQCNSKDSPVIIKDKDDLKDNKRAVAQQGTFSYFRNPCTFFLLYGGFPSIECYQYTEFNRIFKFFEIEKISLLRTEENIKYLQKFLEDNGINESSLCLI